MVEEVSKPLSRHANAPTQSPQRITEVVHETNQRLSFNKPELDRVLGGGLVPGSVILLGGEPGIGKSTLLLTCASQMAEQGYTVLYVSGEESASQIRMTAERLSALNPNLYLLSETNLESALSAIDSLKPTMLVIDSVQTVYMPTLESAPGSVAQIREVTARIVMQAKSLGIATFLVGHVTKDGQIAGPRLLEHMVDTVLYFESTRSGPYRFLRAHKNRFGSTQELGVFEMRGNGLGEVSNPSEFFLSERHSGKPGSSIAVSIEGTRPVLVEVQALCVQSFFGNPRRTSVGLDNTRCTMLAAVLEKHGKLALSGQDLFINVAGGANLIEPAADLPVALAIASSMTNKPIDPDLVCFGEVGLSGEIRGVHRVEARLQEAKRLGFKKVILPKASMNKLEIPAGLQLIPVDSVRQCLQTVL